MSTHKLMETGIKVGMILVPVIYLVTFRFSYVQWKKEMGNNYLEIRLIDKILIVIATVFTSNFFNPKLKFYKKHHERTKGLAAIFYRNFKRAISPILIFFLFLWLLSFIRK